MEKNKSYIFIIIGVLVIVAFLAIGFVDVPKKGDNTESTGTDSSTNTQEDIETETETETETEGTIEISLEEFFGESALNPGVSDSALATKTGSYKNAVLIKGELYTKFQGRLYSCTMQGEQLSLAEKVKVPMTYSTFYDTATESCYLVGHNTFTIDIHRILDDGTTELVTQIEEYSFHYGNPIVIEGGKCYYFSRGNGYALKAIDLTNPEHKVEIYRWVESLAGDFPYITSLQVDNRYIVVEYEITSKYAGVSVYDKKDLKLIIDSEDSMDAPYYINGKLYYLNRETARICVVDLAQSVEGKELIKLTKVGEDFEILVDNDYLYVENYHFEDEEYSTLIYTLEGELVDEITLKDNKDAFDRKFYNNKLISQVLHTTDDYVFMGEYGFYTPGGLFYFEKDKIGTDELVIYTLYIQAK